MIQLRSKLIVVDNSGAKKAKCISVIGKGQTRKKTGIIGSLLLITLSQFFSRKKVKKRTVFVGLILTSSY
jgi:large subunit ribosomal protein L14